MPNWKRGWGMPFRRNNPKNRFPLRPKMFRSSLQWRCRLFRPTRRPKWTAPEAPVITFDHIGGMKDVIERIRMNIIYPFKNPETFRKFNKKPGGGILMYWSAGCGKTHIARATAGEVWRSTFFRLRSQTFFQNG